MSRFKIDKIHAENACACACKVKCLCLCVYVNSTTLMSESPCHIYVHCKYCCRHGKIKNTK